MVKQNIDTSGSISPSFAPHPCSATQMDCSERRNLSVQALRRTESVTRPALERTIADGGSALRAGQRAAWGDAVPCDGDVFHAQMKLTQLAVFLERRAYKCISASQDIQAKMERAKKKANGQKLSKKLALARQTEAAAVDLADEVGVLADWMGNDILSVAGPNLQERQELYDFVVEQLCRLEPHCRHRIRPVRKMLENHLRRSALTNWARYLPIHVVQQLAGHSDIAATRKYYLSVQSSDIDFAGEAVKKILAAGNHD
jgi:hypothetical protein